jgi:hypothetical protein
MMMLMGPIEPEMSWASLVTVRLLRRWVAVRALGRPALAGLVEIAGELGVSANVAIALGSVFQLTEACLERPLEAECCCAALLSRDERAVLLMLGASAMLRPPSTPRGIPHGLPAALGWAIESARRMLGQDGGFDLAEPDRCPFLRA